jgi:hypothetical protein
MLGVFTFYPLWKLDYRQHESNLGSLLTVSPAARCNSREPCVGGGQLGAAPDVVIALGGDACV